jgi:hypothetical protein
MRKVCIWLWLLPVLAVTACVSESKTSTPLSPSVAGPIAGVNISSPSAVAPGVNARVDTTTQPITLVVQNAATTGVRPITYLFEVATDAGFASVVFRRDGIPQDPSGHTSLRLPDPLAPEHTYFWHARAEDGANTGTFTAPIAFAVYTPVVFTAPGPISPINNVTVDSVRPTVTFTNAARTGPAGPVAYLVEASDTDSFANKFSITVAEQPGQTSIASPSAMPANIQVFWHVRAFDPTTTGPWSATQVFRTPAAPPPTGGGGGGGGGGKTNEPVCTDQNAGCAQQIVIATSNEYPDLTRVFGSDGEANDAAIELLLRTIWHLQQAGFNAARQRNPSGAISADKLCIMLGGQWHVYDIFTLGFAGQATTVHFDEITGANPIPDSGIPD